jgi:hypothetical protein
MMRKLHLFIDGDFQIGNIFVVKIFARNLNKEKVS